MSTLDYPLYGVCRMHKLCLCGLCEYITHPNRDPKFYTRLTDHKKHLRTERSEKKAVVIKQLTLIEE